MLWHFGFGIVAGVELGQVHGEDGDGLAGESAGVVVCLEVEEAVVAGEGDGELDFGEVAGGVEDVPVGLDGLAAVFDGVRLEDLVDAG